MVGIEPTTDGLRNRCSTTELHWQYHLLYNQIIIFSQTKNLTAGRLRDILAKFYEFDAIQTPIENQTAPMA